MKLAVLVLIAVVIFAVTAGIIVVQRQDNKTCISYYNKSGAQAVTKECR